MSLTNEGAPEASSAATKIASALAALVVVAGLSAGYFFIRQKHVRQRAAREEAEHRQQEKDAKGPAVITIAENEPQLKGAQVILRGTVRNAGKSQLEDLQIDFELTRRNDTEKKHQIVKVDKNQLNPEDEAKYTFSLPSNTFHLVRVARVYSGSSPDNDLVFNSVQGKPRPKQAPPADYAQAQQKRNHNQNGEEFLNSPDNPVSLP